MGIIFQNHYFSYFKIQFYIHKFNRTKLHQQELTMSHQKFRSEGKIHTGVLMRQLQESFILAEQDILRKISWNGNCHFRVTVKPWSRLWFLLVSCSYHGQAVINIFLTSRVPEDGLSLSVFPILETISYYPNKSSHFIWGPWNPAFHTPFTFI